MPAMRRSILFLLTLSLARAAELAFPTPAATPDLAFPISNGQLGTLVPGSTGNEFLPLLETPKSTAPTADPAKPGKDFTGKPLGEFRFEWLDAAGPVTHYRRKLDLATGIATTTFNRNTAGFTATTFVSRPDDLLVLHLRADKPGFLSFRVRLTHGDAEPAIEDRRILVLPQARAWVYPMESEVTPGDGEITVHGEGEALILVAATSDPAKTAQLPDRMKALGFGGKEHPDIQAIWTGLLERQKKSPAAPDFPAYLKALSKP
jgi:alpha-L-fucosidase 2